MPTVSSTSKLLASLESLQPRDRLLLRLLQHHSVLTTPQLHTLAFSSLRLAQRRLRRLHLLGLADRFRWRPGRGGSMPWHWTLGPAGAQLLAAADGRAAPTPRAVRDRTLRIATSAQLTHQLEVNQFFVDLAAAGASAGGRLVRWRSEHQTSPLVTGVRPDGHGVWHAHGRTISFLLEHDTGTEDLPRLVAKLAAYDRAARTGSGPTWPVLLWLHSRAREHNLHRLLAGATAQCPAATAVRDRAGGGPAHAAWWPVGHGTRLRLHELGLRSDEPADRWWHDYLS